MTGVRQLPPQQKAAPEAKQEAEQATRQEFEQRIQTARLGYWIAASICVVAMVAVLVEFLFYSAAGRAGVAPLAPSNITQTSVPVARVTGAQLGGPLNAFTAAFGSAFISGAQSAIWNTNLNDQDMQVFAESWRAAPSATAVATAVWRITLTYIVTAPPTADQNVAICQQFFPSDTVPLADDASRQPVEHLYQSQQLSVSLPASAFHTTAGVAVLPGLFVVTYTADACVITAGVK